MKRIKTKPLKIWDIALLEESGCRHKEFLFVSKDFESATYYHKLTGKLVCIRR